MAAGRKVVEGWRGPGGRAKTRRRRARGSGAAWEASAAGATPVPVCPSPMADSKHSVDEEQLKIMILHCVNFHGQLFSIVFFRKK